MVAGSSRRASTELLTGDFHGARRVHMRPVLIEITATTDAGARTMLGDDEVASTATHLLEPTQPGRIEPTQPEHDATRTRRALRRAREADSNTGAAWPATARPPAPRSLRTARIRGLPP